VRRFDVIRKSHTFAVGLILAKGLELVAALGDKLVLVLRRNGRYGRG